VHICREYGLALSALVIRNSFRQEASSHDGRIDYEEFETLLQNLRDGIILPDSNNNSTTNNDVSPKSGYWVTKNNGNHYEGKEINRARLMMTMPAEKQATSKDGVQYFPNLDFDANNGIKRENELNFREATVPVLRLLERSAENNENSNSTAQNRTQKFPELDFNPPNI
jgi:hypothetical protein